VLRVLDSTVLIDFLRGRPAVGRVMALRASGDVPATTAINVEEIVRGLRAVETQAASQLFSGLVVLPIDSRAASQAGTWRRTFAARGVTLYQSDCLVAATAWVNGGALATGNPKDFPMRELKVEHWPVGK
jgi:predicted nucleic acid-binding protein